MQGRKLLDESLALTRTVGDPTTLEFVLHSLADCALDQEVHDEAARLYHESLDIAARTNAFRVIADCLGGLAAVEACRGRPESAGRLWRAVRAFERESGYLPLAESERSRYERALSDVPLLAPATGAPWADVLADAIDYAGSLRAQQPTASSA